MQQFLNKKIKVVWSDSGRDKVVFGFLTKYEDGLLYVEADTDGQLFAISSRSLISIKEVINGGKENEK